jgi:hypothetical protein
MLTLERRVRETSSTRDLGMQPQYAWTLKQNSGRAGGITSYLEHLRVYYSHISGLDLACSTLYTDIHFEETVLVSGF